MLCKGSSAFPNLPTEHLGSEDVGTWKDDPVTLRAGSLLPPGPPGAPALPIEP